MPYLRSDLSGNIGVGAGVPTLHTYSTPDTNAAVSAANYFNGSADIFEPHDIIKVVASDGFGIYRVVSNDGVSVVVALEDQEV